MGAYMRSGLAAAVAALVLGAGLQAAQAQAWRECIPGSILPGGCDSIEPGGGRSIEPGGGLSILPGGGRSIEPGGGQSIEPGGGRSIEPGGGLAIDRDWSRGLDPDTLRPRTSPFSNLPPMQDTSAPTNLAPLIFQLGQIIANRRAAKAAAPFFVQALQEGRCEDAMALAFKFGTKSDGALAMDCMLNRAAAQNR